MVCAAHTFLPAARAQADDEADPPGQEAPAQPGIRATKDVPYVPTPTGDARLQSLDLYAPERPSGTAALLPLCVYVHGGAWAIGDKRAVGEKARAFVEAGFLFASVNYRLSPRVTHPAHVEDVAAAVGHLARNGRALGLDPSRIVLIGHSAGAHLVALLGTDGRRLAAEGVSLTALRGVIPLDGAGYDIAAQVERNPSTRDMFERAFGQDPAGWRDASPASHVASGKGIPPFLLVHAGRRPGSALQSKALAERLEAAGVRARLHHEPEKNHASVNRDLGKPSERLTDVVLSFAKACVGGELR